MSSPPPSLGQYVFLPWLRRGLSSSIAPNAGASLPYRAALSVGLQFNSTDPSSEASPQTASVTANLYGPGDVVGFSPDRVIRTEPLDLTTNFESNYFAGIEFDQPDFPWLFTPAAANQDQLCPWISLIVLADNGSEFQDSNLPPNPLPAININATAALPDLTESWNWAHSQISGTMPADLAGELTANPHIAISRLICPRRFNPDTAYRAFVVPTFNAGKNAGLGVPNDSSQPLAFAWDNSPRSDTLLLPYYYVFRFHTSDAGDFESLVRRLTPQASVPGVGDRSMDITNPGLGIPANSSEPPVLLGGALQTTNPPSTAWSDPAGLQGLLAKIASSSTDGGADPNPAATADPTVGPPLYGRWYAGVSTVNVGDQGWVADENLDPRRRVASGFGSLVILHHLSYFLRGAWAQFSQLKGMNYFLRRCQASRRALQSVYKGNYQLADAPTLLGWTQPVQSRILTGSQTVAGAIQNSTLPPRTLSAAFRRLLRPYGPIRQRGDSAPPYGIVTKLNNGTITVAPTSGAMGGFVPYQTTLAGAGAGTPSTGAPPSSAGLSSNLLFLLLGIDALIALILFWVAGFAVALTVFLIFLALIVGWFWSSASKGQGPPSGGGSASADNLTAQTVAALPPQPSFTLQTPGGPIVQGPIAPAGTNSADAQAFGHAAEVILVYQQAGQQYTTTTASVAAQPVNLSLLQAAILTALNPNATLLARARGMTSIVGLTAITEQLEAVMAAPTFPQPMFKPLAAISQDYLLPGIGNVPRDSLMLLQEDHGFIEAYMLGLNVELARHLLYDGFPTDQRGTCFRQFWEISANLTQAESQIPDNDPTRDSMYDIPEIVTWPLATPLGQNENRTGVPDGNLVLMIRGEVLKRYPNTIIYACPAKSSDGSYNQSSFVLEDSDPSVYKSPLYRGTLSPDVTFLGFDLTKAMALSNKAQNQAGWFFVFEEIPSETRFGLEPATNTGAAPTVNNWGQLSWSNFSANGESPSPPFASSAAILYGVGSPPLSSDPSQWGVNAAQTACITMRGPERVAFHADTMLIPRFQTNAIS